MSVLNCPRAFSACDSFCDYFSSKDDTCSYFKWELPVPLSDILTPGERLDRLESEGKADRQPTPKELIDSVHKLQVLVNDLQNRLNKYLDIKKRDNDSF